MMRSTVTLLHRLLATVGMFSLLCGDLYAADAPQRPSWWDAAWKYCQTIHLYTPPLSSGINTAMALIDPMGMAQSDGRDVRVVTAQKTLLPYQVEKVEGGLLRILFQVPPDGSDIFYIYYGNPSAPDAQGQWEKRLGGLMMETRALIPQRWTTTWEQVQQVLAANTPVFGRGPRPCINDSRNPFGPQQEHFCAIYKGTIFCPESGRYTFATNSDDASFLLIDGKLVCEWPGAHDASVNFYEHSGEIELVKGIHSIEYYLVQLVGAARSFAGWKKPSDKEPCMIPPEAFVQTLLTRVIALHEHDKSLSAYFEPEIGRKIRFNKTERIFTQVTFRDCSSSKLGKLVSWRWDFGDGVTSTEQNPVHEYTQNGEYKVSLEVRDNLGYSAQVTRTVKVMDQDAQRVSIFFDIEQDENVLMPTEPFKVTLRFRSSYPYALPLTLHSMVKVDQERLVQDEKDSLSLERDVWQALKKEFPCRPGPNTIIFSLRYLGVPIAESAARILPTSVCKGPLTVMNNSLLDKNGELVILRLGAPGQARWPEAFSTKLASTKPCKIVIVEDSLSPAEGKGPTKTFRQILKEKLSAAFPEQSVEIIRVGGVEQSAVYPPLERLARVVGDVVTANPDIVIWSCSLSDIMNYVPIETFDRYLKASVEMILAQTHAAILLVSCPPIVVNPEMGHGYAFAMKKVALKYNLPSVDLFSIFCRMGVRWKFFFRDEAKQGDPVYCLYPNIAGQELIAKEIFEKLID